MAGAGHVQEFLRGESSEHIVGGQQRGAGIGHTQRNGFSVGKASVQPQYTAGGGSQRLYINPAAVYNVRLYEVQPEGFPVRQSNEEM